MELKGAWIDGIKGKFKRGRRTATSYVDAAQALGVENGYDRLSGDEELGEKRLAAQTSVPGQKRARHEFEVDSDDEHYETGEMPMNGHGKDSVCIIISIFLFMIYFS